MPPQQEHTGHHGRQGGGTGQYFLYTRCGRREALKPPAAIAQCACGCMAVAWLPGSGNGCAVAGPRTSEQGFRGRERVAPAQPCSHIAQHTMGCHTGVKLLHCRPHSRLCGRTQPCGVLQNMETKMCAGLPAMAPPSTCACVHAAQVCWPVKGRKLRCWLSLHPYSTQSA
jgi:hypothetical protein